MKWCAESNKDKSTEWWWFGLILMIGLILRGLFVANQGLSNDELSALYRTRFSEGNEFWWKAVANGDMHPFLYQWILTKWVGGFGSSDGAIRSLPLLFYSLNLLWMEVIGRSFFSRFSTRFLQLSFAISGFFVVHTATSRPYALGLFFILMLLYLLLRLREKPCHTFKQNSTYVLVIGLAIWGAAVSHYFAGVVVGMMGVVSLFHLQRAGQRVLVLAGLTAASLFAPHLAITWHQIHQGGLGWLDPPSWTWLFDFTVLVFNQSTWLVLLFCSLLLLLSSRRIEKAQRYTLISLASIVVVVTLISWFYSPIVRELIMQFLWPLLIWGLMGHLSWQSRWSKVAWVSCSFAWMAHGFVYYRLMERRHYSEFEAIAIKEEKLVQQLGAGNVRRLQNAVSIEYFGQYQNIVPARNMNLQNGEDLLSYRDSIEQWTEKNVIYSFSNAFHHPAIFEMILCKYPHLHHSDAYFQSGIYHFSSRGIPLKEALLVVRNLSDTLGKDDEFIDIWSTSWSFLPKIVGSKGYFVATVELTSEFPDNVFLVAVANRKDEILLNNAALPVLYEAFDKRFFERKGNELKVVFEYREQLQEKDELKLYIWNPSRHQLKLKSFQFGLKRLNS